MCGGDWHLWLIHCAGSLVLQLSLERAHSVPPLTVLAQNNLLPASNYPPGPDKDEGEVESQLPTNHIGIEKSRHLSDGPMPLQLWTPW